jgi:hypothetical protein
MRWPRAYLTRMRRALERWSFVVLLTLVDACDREPAVEPIAPSEPAPTVPTSSIGRAPSTPAEDAAVQRAREAAQHLGRTLRGRLMAAMAEGPEAAARVCAEEAQALTAQAATERGARVGRTSMRLRNPDNEGPEWPREWLAAQGPRPASDAQPQTGIADGTPAVARFVAPIAIEGPCLLCHGPAEGIPEGVRTVLRERYPSDHATGYALGDLRGALWAEVDVAP